MRRAIATSAAAAALGVALAFPAAGSGALIGNNLVANPNITGAGCMAGTNCTTVQDVLPPALQAPDGLTSPIDGVVTRWRIKSGTAGALVTLRILTRNGTTFTATGASAQEAVTTDETFLTRVPIATGQYIGLDNPSESIFFSNTALTSMHRRSGDLANGVPQTFTQVSNHELALQATVELDADKDGFGDESQDGCTSQAGAQAQPCNVFTIKSAKAGKKGKATVVASVPGAGTLSASGKAIKSATTAKADSAVGDLTLHLKPSKSTKRKLRTRSKLKTTVTLTYAPTGGAPARQTAKVTLKAASKGK